MARRDHSGGATSAAATAVPPARRASYSGRAAEDVLDHPLVVLETTGLSRRLSPHRLAAYRQILARLRELAS